MKEAGRDEGWLSQNFITYCLTAQLLFSLVGESFDFLFAEVIALIPRPNFGAFLEYCSLRFSQKGKLEVEAAPGPGQSMRQPYVDDQLFSGCRA